MDYNKYNKKIFNKDSFIDKRIKALFLYFDSKSINVSYKNKIKLLNISIVTLVKFEEYELAQAFKIRKINNYKRYRRNNRKKTLRLLFRLCKYKLTSFLRKLF